jgi:hypothetical protein
MMARNAMTATLAPALLLLCGAAAGPHGLAILTEPVLSFLDPAAPVALAVFGILAAMRIQTTDDEARGNITAAALQAAITGTIVAAAFLLVPPNASTGEPFPGWNVAAITLGIAAATSFDAEDCILPVIAGGLLLAFARETSSIAALLITLEAGAIAALIAGSGWLLLSRTSAVDEHRVSTMGSALLLGGAADYLSMSALLFGLTAGGCWRLANSAVREHIRRDVAYVAHSLLALVLVMAGAHAMFSIPLFAIAVGYTVLRASGKLTGSWIADRVFPAGPRPTAQLLMTPGAFGVAFALNVVRAMGTDFEPVLTVVVIGTVASSFIAALARPEVEA